MGKTFAPLPDYKLDIIAGPFGAGQWKGLDCGGPDPCPPSKLLV